MSKTLLSIISQLRAPHVRPLGINLVASAVRTAPCLCKISHLDATAEPESPARSPRQWRLMGSNPRASNRIFSPLSNHEGGFGTLSALIGINITNCLERVKSHRRAMSWRASRPIAAPRAHPSRAVGHETLGPLGHDRGWI